jgi:hypothetical protein
MVSANVDGGVLTLKKFYPWGTREGIGMGGGRGWRLRFQGAGRRQFVDVQKSGEKGEPAKCRARVVGLLPFKIIPSPWAGVALHPQHEPAPLLSTVESGRGSGGGALMRGGGPSPIPARGTTLHVRLD